MSGNTRQQLEAEIEEVVEEMDELADSLEDELDDARAATTVQLKAMIQRLREKREAAREELQELMSPAEQEDEGQGGLAPKTKFEGLATRLKDRLSSMKTTINRRIH